MEKSTLHPAAATQHAPQMAPYPTDKVKLRDGSRLCITFFKHASLALTHSGHTIYVDPVKEYADYATLEKADLVVVTHSHYDHLDKEAIAAVRTSETNIVCDHTSAEEFTDHCFAMRPGDRITPREYVEIEAIAAYNTSEGHMQFHPREREDCGYVLTIGGSRIYISGDTEPTEEMLALRGIDIAFLPVNQPYTMTVDQAVGVIREMRPAIFYPYHYGEVDERTDIDRLVREVQGMTEIRIRPME